VAGRRHAVSAVSIAVSISICIAVGISIGISVGIAGMIIGIAGIVVGRIVTAYAGSVTAKSTSVGATAHVAGITIATSIYSAIVTGLSVAVVTADVGRAVRRSGCRGVRHSRAAVSRINVRAW